MRRPFRHGRCRPTLCREVADEQEALLLENPIAAHHEQDGGHAVDAMAGGDARGDAQMHDPPRDLGLIAAARRGPEHQRPAGIDPAPLLKTLKLEPPPQRQKGILVKDAAELVAALKQRGLA